MTQKFWRIYIDWDNDGVCEEAEHDRCLEYSSTRGRDRMLKNSSNGFERQRVGTANLQFYNNDRRYDPFNTSSPIYGNIAPDRKIQVGVEIGGTDELLLETGDNLLLEDGCYVYLSDGNYYARFTGTIDDIVSSSRGADRTTRIRALDYLRLLKDESPLFVDVATSTNTGAAIVAILDAISWSDDDRNLTGDGDDLAYWWTNGGSALSEIEDLIESNLGQFYVSTDGKVTYNDRLSIYNTSEDVTITEANVSKNITIPYEWKQIKNLVRVKAYPITTQTGVELWRLYDVPLVKAGQSLTLWADLIYENRFISALSVTTPVANTDYTMNTSSGGGGVDLTGSFDVTVTKLGRRAKIVVTNNAATADGYITLLKLRGNALDNPTNTEVEAEDTDSDYNKSIFSLDVFWQQSTETANDYAQYLVSWLNEPLLFPRVKLEDQDALQFGYDLFARVRCDFDTLEIDTDFFIAKIEERWLMSTGQAFETVWTMEPSDMTLYWIFTTQLGITSVFGY